MQICFNTRKVINIIHVIATLKKKKTMVVSADAEIARDKLEDPHMIRSSGQAEDCGNFLHPAKGIGGKPTADSALHGKKSYAFPFGSRVREGMSFTTSV